LFYFLTLQKYKKRNADDRDLTDLNGYKELKYLGLVKKGTRIILWFGTRMMRMGRIGADFFVVGTRMRLIGRIMADFFVVETRMRRM
jgi:hypothetical protein